VYSTNSNPSVPIGLMAVIWAGPAARAVGFFDGEAGRALRAPDALIWLRFDLVDLTMSKFLPSA
jgi:hypothetical protein